MRAQIAAFETLASAVARGPKLSKPKMPEIAGKCLKREQELQG